MTNLVRIYISNKYMIGVTFTTTGLYAHFKKLGYSRSQVSSVLNNLKKQGELMNFPNPRLSSGFNKQTQKKSAKLWRRML